MQGKFECSQSASTFLSLNRFSIAAFFAQARVELEEKDSGSRVKSRTTTPRGSLLRQGEVCFTPTCHGDGLRLILGAFVPDGDRVAAVRNVFDLVIAAVVGLGKIGSWAHNQISRHIRVYIAEQWYDACLVEGKGTLFTLGPRPEIVSCFLVAADRSPEDVVLHRVAVQELNRRALLYDHDVRGKDKALLIDHRVFFWSGKRFACNRLDVNHRLALHSSNFALDVAGPRPDAQARDQHH